MPKLILPWDDWYHCIGSTYAAWVPGDQRGFRTRHHREHVEGDYKHRPPQGKYDDALKRSRQLITRPAVAFDHDLRTEVCRLFAETLKFYNVEFIDLAVGREHWHLLARFTNAKSPRAPVRGSAALKKRHAYDYDPVPRLVLGKVKSWTTKQLRERGLLDGIKGTPWAKRPKIKPIVDEKHWRNVMQYIADHVHEDAAVWSLLRYT